MQIINNFQRPASLADADDPRVLYTKAYLLIRTVVGFIGILLPIVLIIGEAYFLKGSVRLRGSLSAYYHSPMRDIFVAALAVTGFLLLTYMAGQRNLPDWWLSNIAGIAVLVVAFCPTNRPPDWPKCPGLPEWARCNALENRFGESTAAHVHLVAAATFILSLAAIAYVFARREKKHQPNGRMAAVQWGCCYTIIAAVLFVVVGNWLHLRIGPLTPLYITEVASVWAFGVSWLVAGRQLLPHPFAEPPPASPEQPEVAPLVTS